MDFKTNIDFRRETLKKLLHNIIRNEDAIIRALHDDFRKPAFETVASETAYVISDLKHTINQMKSWARPKWVWPSLINFPSTDYIYTEPYGEVLVIAPWNYPFQLALCPVIAAVAAGNSVVLKPSEHTANTATIISQIISETFDPVHVEVFQGGADVAEKLLERRWDYIFFTGSVAVGKKVALAAAKNLTPVTLELGGKNPCIVDMSANLKLAARRIVWGKFLNAGQTCIAPDYILADARIKTAFLQHLKEEITAAYGANPELSPDLARIVNDRQWERLKGLIESGKVVFGGKHTAATRYIAPTVIDENNPDSVLMQDEIFGPILPVLGYTDESGIDAVISRYEKPLALYIFTEKKSEAAKIIRKYSFGGGCINDTVIQFSNHRLPFGGVGHSGIGAYHGKRGFLSFSHQKPVVKKANWLDIPLRYAPYGDKLKTIRKLLRRF